LKRKVPVGIVEHDQANRYSPLSPEAFSGLASGINREKKRTQMKLKEAIEQAKRQLPKARGPLAIVKEGLHADEFTERDEDGESYGFCPIGAVKLLYRYGEIVEVVQ
jgi:hypothetical protein